jgi:hypothetical protein
MKIFENYLLSYPVFYTHTAEKLGRRKKFYNGSNVHAGMKRWRKWMRKVGFAGLWESVSCWQENEATLLCFY